VIVPKNKAGANGKSRGKSRGTVNNYQLLTVLCSLKGSLNFLKGYINKKDYR